MQHLRIVIAERTPPAATLFCEAASLTDALAEGADYHADEPVELWCEGKFLGRLEQLPGEEGSYWRLG